MQDNVGAGLRYLFNDNMRRDMAHAITGSLSGRFIERYFEYLHTVSVECCLMPSYSSEWYRYWSTFRDSWWY